jgi:hypothetical protein
VTVGYVAWASRPTAFGISATLAACAVCSVAVGEAAPEQAAVMSCAAATFPSSEPERSPSMVNLIISDEMAHTHSEIRVMRLSVQSTAVTGSPSHDARSDALSMFRSPWAPRTATVAALPNAADIPTPSCASGEVRVRTAAGIGISVTGIRLAGDCAPNAPPPT